MPPAKTPPRSVPSLRTVSRLCFQYRRQQTAAAANGLPFKTRLAVSDCRKDRTGTSVDSHQVGDAIPEHLGHRVHNLPCLVGVREIDEQDRRLGREVHDTPF